MKENAKKIGLMALVVVGVLALVAAVAPEAVKSKLRI